ncbi:MAG TPA: extracellular solute-binding protein, partial [Chloroflexota bacterium]
LYTSHALEDGSDIIDAQNYKSLFATDAVTQAIQYQADFIYKDHSAPSPADNAADKTIDFQHGRAAIAFSGYYLISTINGNTKNTWTYDVASMPVNTTGKRVSSSATSGHSAWSGTKHTQESWLWLKYLASEEASKIYGASGLVIPPLIALANSADFTSSANPPHHRKVFIDDLAVAHPFPIVPNWLDVLTAINDMLAPVFAGTKTAKEAIDAGNAKLDTLLQQNAKS